MLKMLLKITKLWQSENDAYHFGLEFAVESFIQAGVQTFSTTSLHEAVRIREIDKQVNIF